MLHLWQSSTFCKRLSFEIIKKSRREDFEISRCAAKRQRDEEQGRVLAPVENGQEPRQSPQLETKNIHMKQQTVKPSPQPEAKVNRRKQQNVKQSPQQGSVQSETKIHQIKVMPKESEMQYQQSGNVQNGHQPDINKIQPQLVDSSWEDNSVATSQDLQFAQSWYVQNGHQLDNNMNQLQLFDSSCQDNSVATSHDLQFAQSGNVQNGHRSDNNMNQPQLVDSSWQDSSVAICLQSPQSGSVQNGHQTDNNKNQLLLVDSSGKDSSIATSPDLQSPQSGNVLNQHRSDNSKFQPQLVDTSCLANFVATSEVMQYQQFGNVQNLNQTDKSYQQMDNYKYQPQLVDTSCLDNSGNVTSEQETIITINNVKSCAVYHVQVQVQDQHLEAVIDTVAKSTILSDEIYNKLDPKPRVLSKIKFHMAGRNITVNGYKIGPVNMRIGSTMYREIIHVVPIEYDMLLGIDFLMQQKMKIEMETNLMTF